MQEYFITVLTVGAVSAVLMALSPSGEVKKGVRFVLSLAVLAAVILPLGGGTLKLPALPRGEAESGGQDGYLQQKTVEAVFRGMEAALTERFDLPEGISLSGEADVVGDTVIVRRIVLTLQGRAVTADVPAMLSYLSENTGAECEVIYGGG